MVRLRLVNLCFLTKILNGIIMKVTESNMTNSKCVYKVIMIYNLNDLVIPSRQLNSKVFLLCHCYVNLPKVDLNLSFLKKLMVYLYFYVFFKSTALSFKAKAMCCCFFCNVLYLFLKPYLYLIQTTVPGLHSEY